MAKGKRIQHIETVPNFGSFYYVAASLDPRGDCKRFGNFERDLMDDLIKSVSHLFEVHCLWKTMSDKLFEMLLFIPKQRLSDAEALRRSIAFYENKPRKRTFSAKSLSDLSCYMHYVLRIFSMKWGKAKGLKPRHGKIWSNKHFKSTIVDVDIIERMFTKDDMKKIMHKLKELKVNVPFKTYTGPIYLGANTCGSHEFVLGNCWDGRRRGCVRLDRPHLTSWTERSEDSYAEYDKPSWFIRDMDTLWENLTRSPSCRGAGEIQVFAIPLFFGLYMADGCYRWWKRRKAKVKAQKEEESQANDFAVSDVQ